jgi:hypothetical protein
VVGQATFLKRQLSLPASTKGRYATSSSRIQQVVQDDDVEPGK